MSVQASNWAFAQRGLETGPKLMLWAMADWAGGDGVGWAGQERLSELCECSVRTVRRWMDDLEAKDLIARVQRRRGNGSRTSDYYILAPGAAVRAPLVDAKAEEYPDTVLALAHEVPANSNRTQVSGDTGVRSRTVSGGGSLFEDQEVVEGPAQTKRERTTGPASVSQTLQLVPTDIHCPTEVGKRKVTPHECDLARDCLKTFNRHAGTHFRSKGMVEKVIRRIREHPELALAEHEAILEHAFADPWWDPQRLGQKPRDVGVVYGNAEVFERAMVETGPAQSTHPADVQWARLQRMKEGLA